MHPVFPAFPGIFNVEMHPESRRGNCEHPLLGWHGYLPEMQLRFYGSPRHLIRGGNAERQSDAIDVDAGTDAPPALPMALADMDSVLEKALQSALSRAQA